MALAAAEPAPKTRDMAVAAAAQQPVRREPVLKPGKGRIGQIQRLHVDRVQLLRELALHQEQNMGDPSAAFDAYGKAFGLNPASLKSGMYVMEMANRRGLRSSVSGSPPGFAGEAPRV